MVSSIIMLDLDTDINIPVITQKYGNQIKIYEDDETVSAAAFIDAFKPEIFKQLRIVNHHYVLKQTFTKEELTQEEI